MNERPVESPAPRVFISYSHDTPKQCARVLTLAQQLRRDGIDVRLDQFEQSPPQGWARWCVQEILAAEYVLLICTKSYRARFLGLEAFGKGRGVKWEGNVIQNILYYEEVSTGFVPVILTTKDERHIPETVRGASWYLIVTAGGTDSGYTSLVRRIGMGRNLPPLKPVTPSDDFRRHDTSVPTEEVWEGSTGINAKLDKLRHAQEEHERSSARRHAELVDLVTDPKILRVKMEEKIEETFQKSLAELKTRLAKPHEIDQLYRWRDQAVAGLDESVHFIQSTADELRSPLIRKAAQVLQERGVDAALEELDKALAQEKVRHKEKARQLAEAALFKADLHNSRLEFNKARETLTDAIELDHQWWEPHNRLGLVLLNLAQWSEAEGEFKEAEKFVRVEEDRAAVLGNLATLFQATNQHAEAESLMRQALAIYEKNFGPEHSTVALSLNNIAVLLQTTNRLAEAESLLNRALAINEKNFGPGHPEVAVGFNNLAALCKATNRFVEARILYCRALLIDEENFGPEHPAVASDLNNLGVLLKAMNLLSEAEPLIRRALTIDEKNFGSNHPHVATSLNNLALLLQARYRFADAEPLLRRALAIHEKTFGVDHPSVASDLNNLGALLQNMDRLAEAEPLYRRALAIDERCLGREHPKVAIRLNNLSALLQATGRLAEAEALLRRHLVIFLKFTRASGHMHPHLRSGCRNYIRLLMEMALSGEQIGGRLGEVGVEAGFDQDSFLQLWSQLGAN